MWIENAILGLVLAGVIPAVGLPTPVSAQTTELLIEQGDTIVGLGGLTGLSALSMNDDKVWLALIVSSNPNEHEDSAVLRNGFVTLLEGMPIATDEWIDEFIAIDVNNNGDIGMVGLHKSAAPHGRHAIFWNMKLLARDGNLLVSPHVGAGTRWERFASAKLNDDNQLLVVGVVKNPAQPPSKEETMVLYQLDELGNVLTTNVLATFGQRLPAFPDMVVGGLPPAPTLYAMNDRGDLINYVLMNTGGVVLLNLSTLLAQEGQPSPLGPNWATSGLNASKVAINDRGDHAYTGVLNTGMNPYAIVKNGQKFVRQGDVLPAFAPLAIGPGSPAPVFVANNGDVFWRTGLQNAAGALQAGDEIFMRNFEPLVEANETVVDGKLVTRLENSATSFAISPNGRFFVCRAFLDVDEHFAALFIDLGLVLELPGCNANPGKLSVTSGAARVGEQLEFTMDDGHIPGAISKINFSTRQRVPGSDCGVMTPYGESLIAPLHRFASVVLPPWDGTNPTRGRVAIPPDLHLIDATVFAQGGFREPGTRRNITMTNALRIEIGAP